MSTTNRDDLMNALAALLAKHGTTEVLAALADAADAATDVVERKHYALYRATSSAMRAAQGAAERAEVATGVTLGDACEVLADIEVADVDA